MIKKKNSTFQFVTIYSYTNKKLIKPYKYLLFNINSHI